MSMNFKDDLNPEAKEFLREIAGHRIVASDDRTALFENFDIQQKQMKELANKAKQPVEVELNEPGDVKTMSDGTEYALTKNGWRKLTARANK